MGRIYFDTTPLIYFLDDEKPFSDKVAAFIYDHQGDDDAYFTSTVTDTEYLVHPYRMRDADKIAAYEAFLCDFGFLVAEPGRAITRLAARLRAEYPGLRGMDAIHLATAMHFGCESFLTNDARLRQVSQANVVLVDDL